MNHFPPWSNGVRALLPVLVIGGLSYVTALFWYGASPLTTDVGYEPEQPVPFSHALHNGKMGIDCRYCHNHVEEAAHSNVPTTEVCMNCHSRVRTKDPKLQPVRDSWATGEPIRWVRVHQLPDYAYFNHSAHVNRNVGCQSCHGQINEMERVRQVSRLSMGWCLDCHRAPEKFLRPQENITDMYYNPAEGQEVVGLRLKVQNQIHPQDTCSTCHR